MFRSAVHRVLSRSAAAGEKSRRRWAAAALPAPAFSLSRFSSSSAAAAAGSPPPPQRLAGKVALITGGASGIGKATAAEFVRHGAKVILADVQDDLGRAVAAELGGGGGGAVHYTRCDVADEAQVAAAVDLAVSLHGKLDVMFSNAGVGGSLTPVPVSSLDLADFDAVVAVNLRAAVSAVKHAARVMVVPPPASGGGSIIVTASVAGVLGGVAFPAYSVSKAGVLGLVRAVAGELGRSGVRVNAVSPNYIPTPLVMGAMAEWFPGKSVEERRRIVEEEMNEMVVVGPAAAPLGVEDVASAVVFLASDEARYVNGHNLVVDGGFTVGKVPNMPPMGQ